MKLNNEDKIKLREELENYLSKIKFDPNHRIHIPLEDLETIMFDYDYKKKCKKIGYISGQLCKLDLSELSFKNVDLDTEEYKDFSNTNINFNINECFINDTFMNGITISNMCLRNVDLSNINICNFAEKYGIHKIVFNKCKLENTKMPIFESPKEANSLVIFYDCNLMGTDLSKVEMSLDKLETEHIKFSGYVNFRNSNITIDCDIPEAIKRGRFNFNMVQGCNVKYKDRITYIRTPKEIKEEKQKIQSRYRYFAKTKKDKILLIVRLEIANRFNAPKFIEYDGSKDKFKLSKKDINKLREEVDKLLGVCFYDTTARIKLPKQIIEMLLFDEKKDENGYICKTIGFSSYRKKYMSTNIDRLDFSEVDFSNVSLDFSKEYEKIGEHLFLGGINANIDLGKTYEALSGKDIYVKFVDLGGTDLSNNDLEKLTNVETPAVVTSRKAIFEFCDLRDTKLKVTQKTNASFFHCDLEGVDLSKVVVDLEGLESPRLKFTECDLIRTGLRMQSFGTPTEEEFEHVFRSCVYEGCYVNGKKVLDVEQIEAKKEEILNKYTEFAKEEKKRILSLVMKQNSNPKKEED